MEKINLTDFKEKRKLTEEEREIFVQDLLRANNERCKMFICIMDDIDQETQYSFYGSIFETCLQLCCFLGSDKLVKHLIELGADVNKTNSRDGYSPLMMAVQNGNIETVQILISAGAEVNYIGNIGSSALSEVSYSNNIEIFDLLVSSGVEIEKCGGMALFYAAANGNIDMTEKLVKLNVNVNFIGSDGWTALHYACVSDDFKLVELLMDYGADETIKNKLGKTPVDLTSNLDIKKVIDYSSTKYVLK